MRGAGRHQTDQSTHGGHIGQKTPAGVAGVVGHVHSAGGDTDHRSTGTEGAGSGAEITAAHDAGDHQSALDSDFVGDFPRHLFAVGRGVAGTGHGDGCLLVKMAEFSAQIEDQRRSGDVAQPLRVTGVLPGNDSDVLSGAVL